jgi:hypothetical protein
MNRGENMAETRQIGRLTIHFLGDNAAQLGNSFDGSFAGSKSFRNAMSENKERLKIGSLAKALSASRRTASHRSPLDEAPSGAMSIRQSRA